jgi:3-hydroxy-3-methylglutaryl CoA synthase
MIGIESYGFYVPRWRLSRSAIAAAWGGRQPSGECAVANYDEDALTLAAEAALACAEGAPPADGLLFATTSSPYAEKQVASYLATACDLPRAIWTADFGGSVRAGLSAVLAAGHAVAAGKREAVLVAAADVRLAEPEGELEGWFGDAAAAVCIGRQGRLAEVVDEASVAEEFTHFWRTDDSRFVQVFSGRFSDTYGYARDLGEAVQAVLRRQGVESQGIARLALAAPSARAAADLAKQLGFDPKRQLVTPPHAAVGSSGVADPLLALIAALESAAAGDLILVGAYGEGADVLLLRATGTRLDERRSLAEHLEAKLLLPSYEKYLKYRRLLPVDAAGEAITNVLEHKELKQDVRLYGSRCEACGTVQYPVARVCIKCHAREQLAEHKLSRRGSVFTFTVDHLIANLEHPLPMVVVDLEGGGRVYVQGTDATEDEVQVGQPVVLTFRRLHDGGGNHNYYWKARPPR